ncbi:MAG TPA: BMP family ABC transporter substrate-binding protein [Gaiellaceae bacterium]|nr:BMP family ABC transporter substrate-binding protein [Gaiellaceae bacterium]
MRRKYVWGVLVVSLAVGALALAGGSAAKPQAAFKVAWIYPGPHNDHGWSQAHDAGRLYVQRMLGSKVQTTYKENITSNAQIPQVVAGLVRQGYQMIFGCSFGNFSIGANAQLYKKYPKVLFEEATGTQLKKNQAQYFGAGEDTIYLSGMAAGAASKKGLIGYVVPYGTPEVVRHINAFTLGAQATHPGAKVKIVWTTSWYSPTKETQAAASLVAAGVDVLGQNVDSDATGVYAEQHGIPWAGYDSNAESSAPKQWLTASVYNWGPYYLKRVKAAINGTWKSGFYYGSIKDGFTKLAPFGPKVSAKTRKLILARQKAIESGKFYEFEGPLYDQKGKLMVPKGKRLKVLPDLYSMQWLVKGVVGNISKVTPP